MLLPEVSWQTCHLVPSVRLMDWAFSSHVLEPSNLKGCSTMAHEVAMFGHRWMISRHDGEVTKKSACSRGAVLPCLSSGPV